MRFIQEQTLERKHQEPKKLYRNTNHHEGEAEVTSTKYVRIAHGLASLSRGMVFGRSGFISAGKS